MSSHWGVVAAQVCQEKKGNRAQQKFFKKNDGLLLQQEFSSTDRNIEKTKFYYFEGIRKDD